MNWDRLKGDWMQLKGKVRQKWSKLTDDDMNLIGGKGEELLGRLQHHYGYKKDEAEREVDGFLKNIDEPKP